MSDTQIETRLKKLETHLKAEENDILCDVVQSFRELDKIAYKLGFLSREQSYATRLSWWPMISVLGTYSAGKSTFLNHYLGHDLQHTGTHAVDDKFTVICFSGDNVTKTLPGIALDADPRFPFYQISHDIADIKTDSAQGVDAYLQLKTCPSELLRGKILIDSPGFDADNQRTSTLRLAQHIIDLSDLVLVFFDARHPEPGAMRDTLTHLVSETIERSDSSKFVYILNQMDITAREDNPEEVVAAWQRSLAQAGLTAGRFYRIYNPNVCMPIPEKVKERFEKKCNRDMKEIQDRMEQVGMERAYRVISLLEQATKEIEHTIVPQLQNLIQRWKKRVFWTEILSGIFLVIFVVFGFATTGVTMEGMSLQSPLTLGAIGVLFIAAIFIHLKIGKMATNQIIKRLKHEITDDFVREGLTRALRKNTGTLRTLFIWLVGEPVGWSRRMQQRLHGILSNVNTYIQRLNDRFTNPSGKETQPAPTQPAPTQPTPTQPAPTQPTPTQPTPTLTTTQDTLVE